MLENLTAAGNLYKISPCNIQNLTAVDYFNFDEIFHAASKI